MQTQERLGDDGDAVKPQVDGRGLWLQGKDSGERGPGKLEGLVVNREVSRIADGEVELTEATGAGLTAAVERTTGFSEQRLSYLDARTGRERGRGCSSEGTNEQGKWASGVRALKGSGRAEVAGKCVDVGASERARVGG